MPLNPRQQKFVQEYLLDPNATQAAIRAGYSKRTAEQIGYQLLQKPSVAKAIAAGQRKAATKFELTRDKIVAELVKLGFSNMDDYVRRDNLGNIYTDFSKVTRDQMAAVQEVTVETYTKPGRGKNRSRTVERVKFKLAEKKGVLVDLGKHLGMWPTRIEHEHSGPNGGPIEGTRVISIRDLPVEDREQLRLILLGSKRRGPVTDVEEEGDE